MNKQADPKNLKSKKKTMASNRKLGNQKEGWNKKIKTRPRQNEQAHKTAEMLETRPELSNADDTINAHACTVQERDLSSVQSHI